MPKNSLSLTDNRTGKSYEIPIEDGAVRALDLRQIKVDDKDFGFGRLQAATAPRTNNLNGTIRSRQGV